MISSFRSIGQDALNAGVAVMAREISGRAQNLQRILAGFINGGSAVIDVFLQVHKFTAVMISTRSRVESP